MRVTQLELGLVVLVIGYIAFYGRRPPQHIQDFVSSPVGSILALLGVLGVTVYKSLVLGVFLGIAYIVTVQNVTEYLDEKEQKPEEKKPEATPNAPEKATTLAPAPAVHGALGDLMKKVNGAQLSVPAVPGAQKKGGSGAPTPPKPTTVSVKPTLTSGKEGFDNYAPF